jgi:dCTP deaminase
VFLSDRDLLWAIETERLIVDPRPDKIDATSIDLHLGDIKEAKIWNIDQFSIDESGRGRSRPELYIGNYRIGQFGPEYLINPPPYSTDPNQLVGTRGHEIIVKRGGFLLWPTREKVGTPKRNADFICFVDGKSTKARAGLVVHLTAPTIHSTWSGNITLEIANLGPFDLVFQPDDAIAQLTVCRITSPPDKDVSGESATFGQTGVHGRDAV